MLAVGTSEMIHCVALSASLFSSRCMGWNSTALQGPDMETASHISCQWVETHADCILQSATTIHHRKRFHSFPCLATTPQHCRRREIHPSLPYFTFLASQLGSKVSSCNIRTPTLLWTLMWAAWAAGSKVRHQAPVFVWALVRGPADIFWTFQPAFLLRS